jgi:hypothetical protein
MKTLVVIVMLFMVPGVARAQSTATALQTRPERTNFNETSHYDDVMAFMDAAAKVAPRLIHLTTFANDRHLMDRRADVRKPERMPEYGTFKGTDAERVPSFYYLPPRLTAAIDHLRTHGIKTTTLARPATIAIEEFHISGSDVAREFQGHKERSLKGSWVAAEGQLPAGTVRIDMKQPLARLAFYLIEPRSDDGLVNWNILDEAISESTVYPILRSRD